MQQKPDEIIKSDLNTKTNLKFRFSQNHCIFALIWWLV